MGGSAPIPRGRAAPAVRQVRPPGQSKARTDRIPGRGGPRRAGRVPQMHSSGAGSSGRPWHPATPPRSPAPWRARTRPATPGTPPSRQRFPPRRMPARDPAAARWPIGRPSRRRPAADPNQLRSTSATYLTRPSSDKLDSGTAWTRNCDRSSRRISWSAWPAAGLARPPASAARPLRRRDDSLNRHTATLARLAGAYRDLPRWAARRHDAARQAGVSPGMTEAGDERTQYAVAAPARYRTRH